MQTWRILTATPSQANYPAVRIPVLSPNIRGMSYSLT